jgi:hypothetical protein
MEQQQELQLQHQEQMNPYDGSYRGAAMVYGCNILIAL